MAVRLFLGASRPLPIRFPGPAALLGVLAVVTAVPDRSPVAALVGQGSAYGLGVVIQVVTAAAALPVITRLVEPDEFGLIATALIVTNLLAVTVDLGLARAALRAHFLGETGPRSAAALVAVSVVVAVLVTAAIDALGPWWVRIFADVPYEAALRLAVWGGAAVAVRNAVQAVLRARRRVGWHLTVMVASTAGAQLVGLALLWSSGRPAAYLAGLALGAVAGGGTGVVVVRPALRPLLDRSLLGWAARFALPTVPAELSAVAIWFADRVLIERLLDLEAVGRYQIAYTLGSVVLMLAMAASQAWAPIVHAADAAERAAVTERTRGVLLELTSYLVAGLALTAPLALAVLAPERYRPVEVLAVTAVVALAALPLVSQQAATHLVSDAQRTRLLGSRGLLAVAANVALNLALIPLAGLLGAAVATLLTYLLYAGLLGHAARRVAGAMPRARPRAWLVATAGVVVGAALPVAGGWLALRLVAGLVVLGLLLRAARRWTQGASVPSAAVASGPRP